MRMTLRGVDLEADLARDLLDGFPAEFGVGDGAGAAHEGDAAVAEIVEVGERQFDGAVMVEHDVGDVFGRLCAEMATTGTGTSMLSAGVFSSRNPSTARSTSMRGYCSISSLFQSWQAVK